MNFEWNWPSRTGRWSHEDIIRRNRREAWNRWAGAMATLEAARDLFTGFPSDVSREGVVLAETEVEDAECVMREWVL